MTDPDAHGWRSDMENAPRDGTRFRGMAKEADRYTGQLRYRRRITWWGKTSHINWYGWCTGRHPENTYLWSPTQWQPLPPVSEGGR